MFGSSAASLRADTGAASCWGECLQLGVVLRSPLPSDFGALFPVIPGAVWPGSRADRRFEYGSLGREGEVLRPAVASSRVLGCAEW